VYEAGNLVSVPEGADVAGGADDPGHGRVELRGEVAEDEGGQLVVSGSVALLRVGRHVVWAGRRAQPLAGKLVSFLQRYQGIVRRRRLRSPL
jgi:hypothetical protein